MIIDIKRIDKDLPLPSYQSAGAAAFDLIARTETVIEPLAVSIVPVNLIVRTPPGYFLLLASRSSLAIKKKLMLANGIGVIDEDYCGPEDEIKLSLYNFGSAPVTVSRGERIGQAIFVKIERGQWNEVNAIDAPSRGGFGSTGGYQAQ